MTAAAPSALLTSDAARAYLAARSANGHLDDDVPSFKLGVRVVYRRDVLDRVPGVIPQAPPCPSWCGGHVAPYVDDTARDGWDQVAWRGVNKHCQRTLLEVADPELLVVLDRFASLNDEDHQTVELDEPQVALIGDVEDLTMVQAARLADVLHEAVALVAAG